LDAFISEISVQFFFFRQPASEEKMEDYLDYLYMQNVKAEATRRYSLAEVKEEFGVR